VNVRQPAPFCHSGNVLADTAGLLGFTAPYDFVPYTGPFSAYIASSRHLRIPLTSLQQNGPNLILYKVRLLCYTLSKPVGKFTRI
jgi:hypothetical protein